MLRVMVALVCDIAIKPCLERGLAAGTSRRGWDANAVSAVVLKLRMCPSQQVLLGSGSAVDDGE
jgi:hypothetical protein